MSVTVFSYSSYVYSYSSFLSVVVVSVFTPPSDRVLVVVDGYITAPLITALSTHHLPPCTRCIVVYPVDPTLIDVIAYLCGDKLS